MCTAETSRVISIGVTWGCKEEGAITLQYFFYLRRFLATKLKRGK
jgi:hypothetical protein